MNFISTAGKVQTANTGYIYDKTYKYKGGCNGEKFF